MAPNRDSLGPSPAAAAAREAGMAYFVSRGRPAQTGKRDERFDGGYFVYENRTFPEDMAKTCPVGIFIAGKQVVASQRSVYYLYYVAGFRKIFCTKKGLGRIIDFITY
jgi:hypothetical protein